MKAPIIVTAFITGGTAFFAPSPFNYVFALLSVVLIALSIKK